MINIFIANLDFGITSEDLQATFSQFGSVEYAHVVYDNKTKKSKGFGYVEMPNKEEAFNAISALNGLDVNGRKLDVKIATPKDKREKKEQKPSGTVSRGEFKRERNTTDGPKRVMVKEKRVLRPRRKRTDNNEE